MFEEAIRNKYRFPYNGKINVEELWDLRVEDLDSIYKTLNSKLKQVTEDSLLDKKTEADKELDNKIGIIKYIVLTKQAEENSRINAFERKQKKQKLLALLENKQNEELMGKSAEEIQKMIDEL